MSTLADELLQDFEDSGSEGEGEQQNGGLFSESEPSRSGANGHLSNGDIGMELDGDGDDAIDDDEEMEGIPGAAVTLTDDTEEAKAKVEKMQLGGVSDVRSVAGLMKTLEPVIEVSTIYFPSSIYEDSVYIPFYSTALTLPVVYRKSHTSNQYLRRNRRRISVLSRTTPSTLSSHKRIHCQLPSTMRSFLSTSSSATIIPYGFLSSRL